jgi:hypothetical protein
MKKLRLFGAVYTCATALVLSASANAAIISADWQASGDGLITQYTTNGLEWLDLTVTASRIYNDVYAELAPGGEFYGWRYATTQELLDFIDEFDGPGSQVSQIVGYWGGLHCASSPGLCSAGEGGASFMYQYNEQVNVNTQLGSISNIAFLTFGADEINVPGNTLGSGRTIASPSKGSALVRGINPVPVPAAVWLFCSGLVGLVGMARRKRAAQENNTRTALRGRFQYW